ncbi:MAG: protein kinase [Fibrobacter sp.]|nr:protein kinase [Fibrobacter sp.]
MKIKYFLNNLLNDDNHASLWQSKLFLDDNEQGHQVIVKYLKNDYPDDSDTKQVFIQKANNFLNVKHTSLVHIFDFGIINKRFYTTQEYVDGYSMEQIFQKLKSRDIHFPLLFILPVIHSVIQAVKTIHNHNRSIADCIYRITPSKIFITGKGTVKLIETGILTSFFSGIDTAHKRIYQCPQPINGKLDSTSDIFSIGAILYESITGLPFDQTRDPDTLIKSDNLNTWLPEEIVTILSKSLAIDPKNRYGKIDDMGIAISNFIKKYASKISSTELLTYITTLFNEHDNQDNSQKIFDQCIKKLVQTNPTRITWFNNFNAYIRNNNSSNESYNNEPMLHFRLCNSESSPDSSTSIPNTTSCDANCQLTGIKHPTEITTTSGAPNTVNIRINTSDNDIFSTALLSRKLFRRDTGNKENDMDTTTDTIWTSTRTLGLSGMRLKLAKEKTALLFTKSLPVHNKPTSTSLHKEHPIQAQQIIAAQRAFEQGIEALRAKNYSAAASCFETAVQYDPDNRVYSANLKRIKAMLNN